MILKYRFLNASSDYLLPKKLVWLAIVGSVADVSEAATEGGGGSFAPVLVLGASVIDGTGRGTVADAAVLIEDGMVRSVCARSDYPAEPSARLVDASGLTLLPGLIDAHVHLLGWRSIDHGRFLTEPKELRTIRAVADLRTLLEHGFTAVRDLGSADGIHLRRAVEEGVIAGPRIVSAHKMLCQTAGNGDTMLCLPPDRLDEIGWLARVVDGVDECRKAVRKLTREGADLIKICTSGGGASARGGAQEVQFTIDEVRAMTEEAHRSGRRVAAHAHGLQSIRNALDGEVDTLEHGTFVDDDCCRRMASEGTILVATIVNIKAFAEEGERYGVPASMLARAREDISVKAGSLMRAHRHGVCIAHGSDTGGAPPALHGINAGNLALFVEAGMPPMDALLTATRNAAEALGLGAEIGTLEPGKRADLIAIDGDPLCDISVLADPERIKLVIRGGKIMVDRRVRAGIAVGGIT